MSPSTAPPFCSLTRTARIVPLTRPQTVTFCAMTVPSIRAPSLIWRSEARTSPSIRPKICAGPLHSMLPTIDMSEPMQEAVPAFVVGSDLAHAWSCGCTILPMTSGALTDAFLSFSGTPLFVLVNMSTSCFRRYKVRCANRADFNAAPTYHLLNAAALNSRRNRNFVHRKGEPSGFVGPVFASLSSVTSVDPLNASWRPGWSGRTRTEKCRRRRRKNWLRSTRSVHAEHLQQVAYRTVDYCRCPTPSY